MKSETDTLLPASDLSTWEYSARAAIAFVRPAPIRYMLILLVLVLPS